MSERLPGMPRVWGRNPTASSRFRQRGPTFWTLAIVVAVFAVVGLVVLLRNVILLGATGPPFGLALAAWMIWAALGAWLVGLVDVYRYVPWSINLAMLAWGAFPAGVISAGLKHLVPRIFEVGYPAALTAGVFEEGIKLLGVVLLAAIIPVVFRRPMGVLVCAMLVGLGFSLAENVMDTLAVLAHQGSNAGGAQSFATVIEVFLVQGFANGMAAHLAFSGLASMGLYSYLSRMGQPQRQRWRVAAVLFVAAVLLHFCNDMPLGAGVVGQVINNGVQIALLAYLIAYAVRAERRWLSEVTSDAAPVIEPAECRTLRTHRSRKDVQADISDRGARQRMKALQWAQIGYVNAVSDGAPIAQIDRLASYAAMLRRRPAGTGWVPGPRRPAPSGELHSATEPPR